MTPFVISLPMRKTIFILAYEDHNNRATRICNVRRLVGGCLSKNRGTKTCQEKRKKKDEQERKKKRGNDKLEIRMEEEKNTDFGMWKESMDTILVWCYVVTHMYKGESESVINNFVNV